MNSKNTFQTNPESYSYQSLLREISHRI